MSRLTLENGKVYRFHYDDAQGRDRGIRTALYLGETVGEMSSGSQKFLDLDKQAYRNFVPIRMDAITVVPAEVGYVNVGKLPIGIANNVISGFKADGYTVFRDGDHVNAVKGWETKMTVKPIGGYGGQYRGFSFQAEDDRTQQNAACAYVDDGVLRVWNGLFYDNYPNVKAGAIALRDRLTALIDSV